MHACVCVRWPSPTNRFGTLKLGYIGIRISICNINGLLIRRSLMMRLSVAPQRMLPYRCFSSAIFRCFKWILSSSTLHWINNVGRCVSISIFRLKSCFFHCMMYFVRGTLHIFIFIKLFNVKFMSYWIFYTQFRYNATSSVETSLVLLFTFLLFHFFYNFYLVHLKTVSMLNSLRRYRHHGLIE